MRYGGIDRVPEHRPDTTPGGKPTLRKRTKTDRNALYAAAVASTVLATAKEALPVAVAATEARVLVVRPHGSVGVEPVYAGTLRRELFGTPGVAQPRPAGRGHVCRERGDGA